MTEKPTSIRLINARIYRSAADSAPADCIVTRGSKVVHVGSRDDAPAADITRDMQGATVLPGLTDAHVHLYAIASERLQAPLFPPVVRTIGEVLDKLSTVARKVDPGDWVRGAGFDENRLAEGRYPTRVELDAAVPDRPLIVRRFCGHTAIVNSAALQVLGLDEGISDPEGGVFERDAGGRLNGIAKESAADQIYQLVPKIGRHEVAQALRATIADELRMGIIATVEAAVGFTNGFDEEFATWQLLRDDPGLLRLGFMYQLDPQDAAARGLTPATSPDWQAMTLKFFADGIVGARTAAVSKPFCDSGTLGMFMREEGELERVIVEAHLGGWQAAIHAVGDRAVARVIAAFVRGQAERPWPDARHRIEHYFCPPSGGFAAMKQAGAIVVAQPNFVSRMRRSILAAFGPEAGSKYPARSVIDAGVTYVGSSDAPTGDVSPWVGMGHAVDRGAGDGDPIGPQEALSRREAVGSYIHGGAFAMKHEAWRGTLQPGMAADLIAVDRDPFAASSDLATTGVLMTMLRGEVVYDTMTSRTVAPVAAGGSR